MEASGATGRRRAGQKGPQPLDRQVGARIMAKRKILKISQQELASRIGVTFQQVQKYEKGRNRIGASRLQQIADVLGVPVSYFFAGREAGGRDEIADFLSDPQAPRLIRHWSRVPARVKRSVAALIERVGASAAA